MRVHATSLVGDRRPLRRRAVVVGATERRPGEELEGRRSLPCACGLSVLTMSRPIGEDACGGAGRAHRSSGPAEPDGVNSWPGNRRWAELVRWALASSREGGEWPAGRAETRTRSAPGRTRRGRRAGRTSFRRRSSAIPSLASSGPCLRFRAATIAGGFRGSVGGVTPRVLARTCGTSHGPIVAGGVALDQADQWVTGGERQTRRWLGPRTRRWQRVGPAWCARRQGRPPQDVHAGPSMDVHDRPPMDVHDRAPWTSTTDPRATHDELTTPRRPSAGAEAAVPARRGVEGVGEPDDVAHRACPPTYVRPPTLR